MKLPEKAAWILHELNAHGFEGYVVGGCVRDAQIGRIPGDWDITTSASPIQTKEIFPFTIDTGIAHGTVTVMVDGEGFEVTTYRVDGEYRDGRHPETVAFTANLEEDLKRRDFTINAMAYHPESGIVDLFGGRQDLEKHVIRCVGDPMERFHEDALRMMRALRFRAQLNFTIEDATADAIRTLAPRIEMVSRERIQVELVKLLLSEHPEYLTDAAGLNLEKYVFPLYETLSDSEKKLAGKAAKLVAKDKALRFAVLFCTECGSKKVRSCALTADEILTGENDGTVSMEDALAQTVSGNLFAAMKELRFDNDTMNRAALLVLYHRIHLTEDAVLLRKVMSAMKPDPFFELIDIQRAWAAAGEEAEKLLELDRAEQRARQILTDEDCLDLKHLALNGQDLKQAGVGQGKEIGRILAALLTFVLENPEKNTKEQLWKVINDNLGN